MSFDLEINLSVYQSLLWKKFFPIFLPLKFTPNDPVTRFQLLNFEFQNLKILSTNLSNFSINEHCLSELQFTMIVGLSEPKKDRHHR